MFDNDYKHPVVLAKEMATIDVLSGGRVEFGIGAGWMTTDYEQSGIPYDRPGVRVDRMVEGIAVMKGLFADGAVRLRRRALHDHRARRPAQAASARPHPPFLIGGGGKRVLGIAAREADIVGINPHLPDDCVRLPGLDFRDHGRRDLGAVRVGTLLGLGPEVDVVADHVVEDLRRLPARPRDGRWRGRRAAMVSLVGFSALFVDYYSVNLVISGLHSYAGVSA